MRYLSHKIFYIPNKKFLKSLRVGIFFSVIFCEKSQSPPLLLTHKPHMLTRANSLAFAIMRPYWPRRIGASKPANECERDRGGRTAILGFYGQV